MNNKNAIEIKNDQQVIDWVTQKLNDNYVKGAPDDFYESIKELPIDVLLRSADIYGTAQYFLDERKLRSRIVFFKETFNKYISKLDIKYACKANDLPRILEICKEEGLSADVAGLIELKTAVNLKLNDIIFSAPGKSDEELIYAYDNSEQVILNINDEDELERLLNLIKQKQFNKNRKLRVLLRLKPRNSNVWNKYGTPRDAIVKLVDKIENSDHLDFVGFHCHSSWNSVPDAYLNNITEMADLIFNDLNLSVRNKIKYLDFGGGFWPEGTAEIKKSSYKGRILQLMEYDGFKMDKSYNMDFQLESTELLENFASRIGNLLNEKILKNLSNCRILFEPGRFLVTHSTSILLKVLRVTNDYAIVDGGINMVGDYRFEEREFAPIVNLSSFSLDFRNKLIYGNLCDPYDIWGNNYFGKELKQGDILAVMNQGAYTYSSAWKFINKIEKYISYNGSKLIVAEDSVGRHGYK